MSVNKNGIFSSPNIFESSAKNYVIESDIGKSIKHIPSTGTNSVSNDFTVDYSNCTQGETVYISLKVEWNGFDTSNTNGTFNIWFQGSTYNASTSQWDWTAWATYNNVAGTLYRLNTLKELVLSSSSGSAIIKTQCTLHSNFPSMRTKEHVHVRADYSNGTGWIKISDLEVIPEKYYIPQSSSGTALRIGKDYISAREIYEI